MEHLSRQEPLIFGEDFLFDLVRNYPLSSVKDAQTGKYIKLNYRWAENLGLDSADELIGLTVSDLTYKERSKAWSPKEAFIHLYDERRRETQRLDDQAKISQQCVNFQKIFFDSNGFIILEETRKVPVVGYRSNKTTAIFTHGQNITFQISLFSLLDLYKKYYPEKQAIQQLLRYLRLDQFFTELPTLSEMRLLFTMRQDPRHKCVAKSLELSVGTVEIYAHKLRDKLTTDLNNVLAGLRAIPHI